MNLYKNHLQIAAHPLLVWRYENRFLLLLDGYHITNNGVFPVYRPLISFVRHHLGIAIEFPWFRIHFLVVPPFIDFEKKTKGYIWKRCNYKK